MVSETSPAVNNFLQKSLLLFSEEPVEGAQQKVWF